jgi:hypothetical protein
MKQKFFVSGIIASLVAIVYLLSFSKKESVQVTYDVQRPIQQRLLKIRRHTPQPVVKPAVVQPVVKPPPPVESIVYPTVTKSAAASLITIPDLNVPDLNESASPFDFQTPPAPVSPPLSPAAPPPPPPAAPPALSPTAAAAFTTAAAVRSRPRRLTGSISAKPVLAKIPEVTRSSAFTSILDL